MKTSRCQF